MATQSAEKKPQDPMTDKDAPEKSEKPADNVVKLENVQGVAESRLALAVEKNNFFHVDVKAGTTKEEVLDERFWEHVSMKLRPGDEIRVRPDDMSWEMLLHVANAGKQFAHVVEKAFYPLNVKQEAFDLPSIYTVEFAGTHHKWRVLRHGNVLKDGFATEQLAKRYALNQEEAANR